MKKVDYDLLRKHVNFPIEPDPGGYKCYVWDSDDNMIAMFDDDVSITEYEAVLGEMVEHETTNDTYVLECGDFIDNFSSNYIGCVRGWGRLQKLDNPEQIQDNVANYLLNCLNNIK